MIRFRSEALKDLFADVKAAGWKWRRGSKHIVIYPPDGSAPIMLSVTAYDGVMNAKVEAMLRRRGLPKRKDRNKEG